MMGPSLPGFIVAPCVEGLSVLANGMGKGVVQAPCQQLSCQLGYLKRSVMFHLLPVVQDY
jgi:hypothetical protein